MINLDCTLCSEEKTNNLLTKKQIFELHKLHNENFRFPCFVSNCNEIFSHRPGRTKHVKQYHPTIDVLIKVSLSRDTVDAMNLGPITTPLTCTSGYILAKSELDNAKDLNYQMENFEFVKIFFNQVEKNTSSISFAQNLNNNNLIVSTIKHYASDTMHSSYSKIRKINFEQITSLNMKEKWGFDLDDLLSFLQTNSGRYK